MLSGSIDLTPRDGFITQQNVSWQWSLINIKAMVYVEVTTFFWLVASINKAVPLMLDTDLRQ